MVDGFSFVEVEEILPLASTWIPVELCIKCSGLRVNYLFYILLFRSCPSSLMPITPNFTIDQTDTHVLLEISVPHIRVCDLQVVLTDDNTVLHFASVPPIYLLVLSFAPHSFQEEEDEACNAKFDPMLRNGTVRLELRKKSPGQWENLDLGGRLQMTAAKSKSAQTSNWLLAVEDASLEKSDESREEVQWSNGAYGFARMFSGIFTDLSRDGLAKEMLELPWDDETTIIVDRKERENFHSQRRSERIKLEHDKFDPNRYLADTFGYKDDYLYQCAMEMQPHWNESEALEMTFDQTERSLMMSIPYPLIPKTLTDDHLLFPLIDVLFAYVYDHLITYGDPTVESAWTVSILSASLSSLEDWSDNATTLQVLESCVRRSLVYPYLRCFSLSMHVLKQVACILRRGLRTVIRCFLQVRRILDRSELYYLGNKIFIDPYLAWLQNAEADFPNRLLRQAEEIEEIMAASTFKNGVGLDLADAESAIVELDGDHGFSSEQEDDSDANSSDASENAAVRAVKLTTEDGLVSKLNGLSILE